MKKILITFFFFLFNVLSIYSQNYLISQGGTVTTCGENFYDSGGAGGNYGNNENFVMTFHSNHPTNTHIRMSFNTLNIEPGDTLIVYDGSNTSAPIIGKYNNNLLPPSFVSASIYNSTGDLTFRFKSNASVVAAGWFASFVCTPACQTIVAQFHPTLTTPHPNDSNYIDICIGNPITFAAKGSGSAFPQNGILYNQDSTNCTFLWDFGDGTTATGQIVTHTYTIVRGYDVALTITDSRGCTNSNYLGGRVRISRSPFAQINGMPDICSSTDTTYVTIGYNSSSVVVIEPITSIQSASERFDSTMFIPDGPNCPVQCYNTFVTFTAFLPGSTITAANNIQSICVNMEHSFAGDLGFRIICPSGQSVVLDPNTHSGGKYLGEPYGGINHGTYDQGCNPANNPAGIGWVYCWSEIYPTVGTMDWLSTNGGGYGSTGQTIDSTNRWTHQKYIQPNNPLSGLIGCPLNGTWNIEICDDYGIDNGYIFWWELNLDPSLLPVGWSYQVPIDTVLWDGSFFSIVDDSTIMIVPDSGGIFQYTVTVIDAFGCSYDTTLYVQVVQTPVIDLGSDTVLCGNNLNYILDAGPGDIYSWSTGNNTQYQPVTSTGWYFVTVGNQSSISNLICYSHDTVFVKVLAQPSQVDLGPDICSTVPITLNAGNNGFQYIWSNNMTTQTINVTTSGTYSVSVAEEFGYNCEVSDAINVTIIPEPIIDIGPDTSMCSFNYMKLKVKDQNGYLDQYPYTYQWSWGQTTRSIEIGCLPIGDTTISVVVTGCTSVTDTRKINARNCELTLYNIITPNGDGFNDVFKIKGIENFPNSNLKIYNRWGKKIYESDNYGADENNLWDAKGEAEGVYYYVLTVNYGNFWDCVDAVNYHGTITVLR